MGRIEKEVFWPKLEPEAEKKGLKVLAVWENGYRHITNNKRPIKVPADLKGIKLRVPEGKWRVKMFQAYGANPSPMKFSELFTALQTGVMDGQENPFTQIYSAKLQEVQKYLSLSGHVYTPAYLTVGTTQVGDRCPPTCARSSRTRPGRRRRTSTQTAAQGRRRPARQAEAGGHAGQRGRQGRLRRGQQADLRGVRQGSRRARRKLIDRAVALGK